RPATWPWHRKYLLDFENALREIDPNVVLPYWDEERDANDPFGSNLFTDKGFGSSAGIGNCVPDGPFTSSNFQLTYIGLQNKLTFEITYKRSPHCLTRGFLPNQRWVFPANSKVIDGLMEETSYDRFSAGLDVFVHAVPHIITGLGAKPWSLNPGDMASTNSPGDPLFWLHHAYLDLLWWRWQNLPGTDNTLAYTGKNCSSTDILLVLDPAVNCFIPTAPRAADVSLNDPLDGYPGSTVRDVMIAEELGYTYERNRRTTPPKRGNRPPMVRGVSGPLKEVIKRNLKRVWRQFEEICGRGVFPCV
ncbi:hypothetical protein HK102_001062, partial [Quaeritorhiza haematococci]